MGSADADLLFLDIELAEGEDGFGIARQLMDSGNQCKVCFLTSHTEMARLGYRVNAFRYIDKRHLEEITEALDFFLAARRNGLHGNFDLTYIDGLYIMAIDI